MTNQTSKEDISSDESSELMDSGNRGDGAVPVAKHAKPARRRKSRAKNVVVELPLDVLYEILQLVPPDDLLSVARTSRLFWSILSSSHSQGLWRASRKNERLFDKIEIPDPPSHVTERRWAYLLFGRLRCHSCDAPWCYNIMFSLLRRSCLTCMEKNLVLSSELSSVSRHYDKRILDFIPYVDFPADSHLQEHTADTRFYWKDDVYAMIQQHGRLVNNVRMGKRGALNRLALFEASRVKLVLEMKEFDSKMRSWIANLQEEQCEEIRRRLALLGWTPDEIRDASLDADMYRITLLTNRSWNLLLTTLEHRREAWRIKALMGRLKPFFATVYQRWLSSTPPLQCALFPNTTQICRMPETVAMMKTVASLPSNPSDDDLLTLTGWVSQLPALTARWVEKRKEEMVSLIPSTTLTTDALSAWFSYVKKSHTDVHSVCVFRCTTTIYLRDVEWHQQAAPYPVFIGVDEAVAHSCYPDIFHTNDEKFEFSLGGTEAYAALVRTAGVPVDRHIALSMDIAEVSFVCMNCPVYCVQGYIGRNVMGWRQCISHYADSTHEAPAWQLVKKDDAPRVVVLDNRKPQYTDGWACMRCSEHVITQSARATVEEHLQTKHNIAARDVQEGVDLFWFPRRPRPDLPPRILVLDEQTHEESLQMQENPEACYRCLQCPVQQPKRLFILAGVRAHCKAKHKVDSSSLKEGFHYLRLAGTINQ
ncbi:hypothetical protein BDW22DRAFT_1355477 [Trametopsis cervina]|nr:hypothetical protein BDW22DRAFT_1355477 [Trametopsis cervina]